MSGNMNQNQPGQGPGTNPGGPRSRPGAMTMAMQAVQIRPATGPKVLRIGLIQGGKIVEERIIRERKTVAVGTSEKNQFVILAPGMPPRFELFQLVGNDYILNFTDQMRGRVGLPGGVQDLDQLRKSGGARNAGTHYQVKLSDTSRGKIVIGDVTLLFQFVAPPPVQPRPQLPAAARGGFAKSIDWLFTAFVMFSFMAHFGFIIYLENADWPLDQNIATVDEVIARHVFEEPPPPEEENEEETDPNAEAESQTAEANPAPTKNQPRPDNNNNAPSNNERESGAESQADATARIAQEAAQQAETLLLGAFSAEGSAFADALAGGAVTGSAEEVMANAAGVGVAQGGPQGVRTRTGGGGSGAGSDLGNLAAAGGPGATQQAGEGVEIVERVVRGRVTPENVEDTGGEGEFDSAIVVRTIRGRISAIQRCYETSLRQNPTLAGKVTVQFTIQPTGGVSGARATENSTGDAGVASCVVGAISRLRFNPGPEGGSVEYSYPFVFQPQN